MADPPPKPTVFMVSRQLNLPHCLWKTGHPPAKPTDIRQLNLLRIQSTRHLNLPFFHVCCGEPLVCGFHFPDEGERWPDFKDHIDQFVAGASDVSAFAG